MRTRSFNRRVPLLNMSLSQQEDSCAASWLEQADEAREENSARNALHQHIARHWQTPWAASFMGGRAALFAVIRTLGLQPGDRIVVPAFTCQCVANAITFNGIEISFADIEINTFGMSARALKQAITPRTRAVLIQYSFGLVCRDIEQLIAVARENHLWVIEDCAHATGGKWQGQLLGRLGDIAFFSSERSKIVNTIHGGWVITANPQLGERLMMVYDQAPEADNLFITALLQTLRAAYGELHNRPFSPTVAQIPQMQPAELAGMFTPQYSWRMAEPVAELLLLQLEKLDTFVQKRVEGASFWQDWASRQGIEPLLSREGAQNTWLRYPVMLSASQKTQRRELEELLNIEIGVWFTTPVHPQPLTLPDCPVGMAAARCCVNLPTWLWDD